ncbi:hypothetical protein [Solidesulfovibrio magneticus]|uniref:Uncharacterized protein n=1 Tax=Solidesulfovibrio magneticus (strain ATCC 700980 / DSM 13731 / RS-1) TaxID=573370 RepID=C4XTI7_SOLM1|nr:hypothetical protein [Solidesulfovibrio magneticus]BAH75984.1 hypothetical protein DMR_24930 [Solidesulfovibrio magneticus RS-1]
MSDQQFFQNALRRKYDILQQQADATTQDAGSRALSVAQQPLLQQQHGQFGLDEQALRNAGQMGVAGLNFTLGQAQLGLEGVKAAAEDQYRRATLTKPLTTFDPETGMRSTSPGFNWATDYPRLGLSPLQTYLEKASTPMFGSGGRPPVLRPFIAGEKGLEMFVPDDGSSPSLLGLDGPAVMAVSRGGEIVPHDETRRLLSGVGGLPEGFGQGAGPGQPQRVSGVDAQGRRMPTTAKGLEEVGSTVSGLSQPRFSPQELANRQMDAATGRLQPNPGDPDYATLYQRTLFNQGPEAVRGWKPPRPEEMAMVITNVPNDPAVRHAEAVRRGEYPYAATKQEGSASQGSGTPPWSGGKPGAGGNAMTPDGVILPREGGLPDAPLEEKDYVTGPSSGDTMQPGGLRLVNLGKAWQQAQEAARKAYLDAENPTPEFTPGGAIDYMGKLSQADRQKYLASLTQEQLDAIGNYRLQQRNFETPPMGLQERRPAATARTGRTVLTTEQQAALEKSADGAAETGDATRNPDQNFNPLPEGFQLEGSVSRFIRGRQAAGEARARDVDAENAQMQARIRAMFGLDPQPAVAAGRR